MSWGISPSATEKEKIFADFNDSIHGMNCADELAYRHYSQIFDYHLGRELADAKYQQGRYDERAELQKAFEHLYGSEYSFQELCDYADKLKTEEKKE